MLKHIVNEPMVPNNVVDVRSIWIQSFCFESQSRLQKRGYAAVNDGKIAKEKK